MPAHMWYLDNVFTKKNTKTTIKLYPTLHDHYSRQFSDIPRPNLNFSA